MFISLKGRLLLNIPRHANEKDNAPTTQVPNKKDSDVKQLIATTMTYQEKAEDFTDAMFDFDGICAADCDVNVSSTLTDTINTFKNKELVDDVNNLKPEDLDGAKFNVTL